MATPVARISVIVPGYNCAGHLDTCLESIAASTIPVDLIFVDDGSTDSSAAIAAKFGAKVVSTGGRRGPAFARNLGAAFASSDLLLFVDADIDVPPDAIVRVVSAFDGDPELDGLFGSYDDEPEKGGFLAQYRNLMHHFVHQRAKHEAQTFWSGFGAVRARTFKAHNGFSTLYRMPAIEDIELGRRLHRAGHKLMLDPQLQVKHLKDWSFFGMLVTDVRDRGIPWTQLMLRDGRIPNDLNVSISQRISVALAVMLLGIAVISSVVAARELLAPQLALLFLLLSEWEIHAAVERRWKARIVTALLILALAAASFWSHNLLLFGISIGAFTFLLLSRHYFFPSGSRVRRLFTYVAAILLLCAIAYSALQPGRHIAHLAFLAIGASIVAVNAPFYALLAAKRGRVYALAAIPFHILFFLYSGFAFAVGFLRYRLSKTTAGR